MSFVEKPSIHAPGINVSTASDVSVHRGSGGPNQVSASSESLATRGPLGRGERSESNISANQRKSGAKDPGLALPKIDPRLKGILDDPLNYYRQYPDDDDKVRMEEVLTENNRWPQPADDNMPPDEVFRLPDAARIPFTNINRPPRGINTVRSDRWPVLLDKKERLQVALARFHELRTAAKAAMEENARAAPPPPAVSSIEIPNKNAAGIDVSTASAVSVHRGSGGPNQVSASSESLATRGPLGRGERSESNISANQRESAAKDSRPAVPKTVPNPQPIPFPSQKELEAQGYRFGPFDPEHYPTDVEMIAYYAKRGYRPLQPHEVDFAEFRCNGVPFAKASDVPHRPKPQEPPPPQKSPEEAERDAIMAKIRRDREAPPKCAANENFRPAPTKR